MTERRTRNHKKPIPQGQAPFIDLLNLFQISYEWLKVITLEELDAEELELDLKAPELCCVGRDEAWTG